MQGSVTEVIAESRELSGSSASKKLRRWKSTGNCLWIGR